MRREMPDVAPERRLLMSRVGPKDTKPEVAVRRALHALGARFRLHRRDLPGTPDVVLPGRRTVVLVHGCFWHRHPGCARSTTPKTRTDYWQAKFDANVDRDARQADRLRALGWHVETIWECETADPGVLETRLAKLMIDHPLAAARGVADEARRAGAQ